MTWTWLLPVSIILPMSGAALTLVASRRPRVQRTISVTVISVQLLVELIMIAQVTSNGPMVMHIGGWTAPLGVTLVADELAAFMLVVSTVEEMNLTREILPDLETQEDDTMFQGQQRIIQEGEAGQSSVLSRVVKRCGVPVASNDLSAVTLSEATRPLMTGALSVSGLVLLSSFSTVADSAPASYEAPSARSTLAIASSE